MRKRFSGIISGLIVIFATSAAFLLMCRNFFKFPMCWLAFGFILLSELLTMTAFALSGGEPKRIGAAVACTIQTVVTIVLSVLFINIFIFQYSTFIVLNIITLSLALIAMICLYSFAEKGEVQKEKFNLSKKSMLRSRAIVNEMINSETGKPFIRELTKLDEDLRFSDDSVVDKLDEMILSELEMLAAGLTNDDYDVIKSIDHIRNSIKQRNFLVKNEKSYQ